MKELIAKILSLFKANNVELTPEQQAEISAELMKAGQPPKLTGDPITLPEGISHNTEAFNKVVQQMQAQNAEQIKEMKEYLEASKKENENLVKLLGEEKAAREAGQKALDDARAKDKSDKITALLTQMKTDGRLPAQNAELESKYKTMLESNYDDASVIIEALPKTNTTPPAGTGARIEGQDGNKLGNDPLGSILTPAMRKELETQPLVKQIT